MPLLSRASAEKCEGKISLFFFSNARDSALFFSFLRMSPSLIEACMHVGFQMFPEVEVTNTILTDDEFSFLDAAKHLYKRVC